jgi:hypothetical protein
MIRPRGVPLAYVFLEDAAEFSAVAEFEHTRFHGHTEGHRNFDGIKPRSSSIMIGLGDVIEIVDTAVGAQRPDGLILKARGLVLALASA